MPLPIVCCRDCPNLGSYDKVVSIEMIEAVGHEHLVSYFATINAALKPGGKAVIQVRSPHSSTHACAGTVMTGRAMASTCWALAAKQQRCVGCCGPASSMHGALAAQQGGLELGAEWLAQALPDTWAVAARVCAAGDRAA
eukprot:GHRQ01026190.1.p2 GENE.GHRQ01026190.1~~GHRQ01026190.1.p2  ORF type:complete len:140 (-),score=38.75 GHRQ01026190.1:155-574(-)